MKSENLSGDEIGKAVMKTAEKEFSYLMTAQSVKMKILIIFTNIVPWKLHIEYQMKYQDIRGVSKDT